MGPELEPGRYRVEMLTEPPLFIDEVELCNGESRTLRVAVEPSTDD